MRTGIPRYSRLSPALHFYRLKKKVSLVMKYVDRCHKSTSNETPGRLVASLCNMLSRHKKPMSVAAERLVAVSPGTWHFGLIHENLNFIEN